MQDTAHKHIALCIAALDGGGAERVFVTLANEFHRLGHQVDMVLVRRSGVFLSELDAGIHVVDLGASRSLFALLPLARYLR
ncbi:MAG TPA: glycosyltransferase, partial [Gemmatimonadaceae bacterium]|nr:glycosyltransferase [Gemmatimonadaceae bacterium]